MSAATSGRRASRSSESSSVVFQYSALLTPAWYAAANLLSVCSVATAATSCVMGCMDLGRLLTMSRVCLGSVERAWNSAVSPATSCCDGTSPVSISQKMPSGSGSLPPCALGSRFCSSGMEKPRKRMPSLASNREVSVSRPTMPRMPPIVYSSHSTGEEAVRRAEADRSG